VLDYLQTETDAERRALEPEIRSILFLNRTALDNAQRAVRVPKCRFKRNWSSARSAQAWETGALLDLARLSAADAAMRADHGDVAGAIQAWMFIPRLVNQIRPDPLPDVQSTRFRLVSISTSALTRIVLAGRASEEECRAMDRVLAKVDTTKSFVKWLETERVTALEAVREARRDPRVAAYLAGYYSQAPGPLNRWRGLLGLGYALVAPLDETVVLDFYDREIALAGQPYRKASGALNALSRRIPPYAWVARDRCHWSAAGYRDRGVANLRLMRSSLALCVYRRRYGRYPASLGDLRQRLECRCLQDPFSGGDFTYHRVGPGYLLYSIGDNLSDDGGTPRMRLSANQLDIVWRVER
jgi:hypothetical protein